jgi:hypothetical protein
VRFHPVTLHTDRQRVQLHRGHRESASPDSGDPPLINRKVGLAGCPESDDGVTFSPVAHVELLSFTIPGMRWDRVTEGRGPSRRSGL